MKEIGLYIHIPFCKKKCYYCDFPSYPGMEEYWETYSGAVAAELALKAGEFRNHKIKTIFIGGGTPSLVPYEHIERILSAVHHNYNVIKDCESTIESNPGTLTGEKLSAYRNAGINRLSMGLQACQDKLLTALGRIHTFKDFVVAVKLAQKHGFMNINADIIFGIPHQTFEDWKETVDQILQFELSHISCYSLKVEEGTVFGQLKEKGLLAEAEDELDRQMYHYAVECFEQAGFGQYEISNFAKPQYQCQHNMNYWERGEYIGIGAGAHSFSGSRRYANTSDVLEYIGGVEKGTLVLTEDTFITEDDGLSEKIILGLRLKRGIDLEQLSKEFTCNVELRYLKSLNLLLTNKLIERDGHVIRLTKKGFDLANRVFVEFI